jgi:fucose permease
MTLASQVRDQTSGVATPRESEGPRRRACAVLFGLSAVAVDAALNAYAARHFGARQVNLMHAAYGIGAASSPLIVTAVIGMGRSWRWAYITVMAIQALLAALFAGTLRRWRDASAEPVAVAAASKEDQSPGRPRWWRRAPAVGGLLVGAVQTGLESAIGLWAFVYLLSAVALPAATAGVIVSSYWAAIVLGRILLGALAQRIGIWPVLGTLTTIAVTASVLLLTRQPVLAAGGIILLGLALAPVYPLLVLTTAERTTAGATDRLVGLQAGRLHNRRCGLPYCRRIDHGRQPNGIRELRLRPRTHQQRWTLDTTSRTPPVKLPIHSHGGGVL